MYSIIRGVDYVQGIVRVWVVDSVPGLYYSQMLCYFERVRIPAQYESQELFPSWVL